MAVFAEHERRAILVEIAEVVEHERDTRAAAALAAPARLADASAPNLLQRVASEDAAAIAALLASGPRLRRVVEAASCSESNVRAVRRTADAGGSSHPYIFDGRPGGAPNS